MIYDLKKKASTEETLVLKRNEINERSFVPERNENESFFPHFPILYDLCNKDILVDIYLRDSNK